MEEQQKYEVTSFEERVDRKTLEEYIVGTANTDKLTTAQLNTFYQIASINNLNPFRRQIYAIPRYNNKVALQPSST